MKSRSDFLPDCHDYLHEYGFEKAAILELLATAGITFSDGHSQGVLESTIEAPSQTKTWEKGMYHRQWFSTFEAACIIEGEHPDTFEDYSNYNIPSNIESMRMAINDAMEHLEIDESRRVSHQSIAAWCSARGLVWPLSTQPFAGTDTVSFLTSKLKESEAREGKLRQELDAIKSEYNVIHEQAVDEFNNRMEISRQFTEYEEQVVASQSSSPSVAVSGATFAKLASVISAFPLKYPDYQTDFPPLDKKVRQWLFDEFGCDAREKHVFGKIIYEHFWQK